MPSTSLRRLLPAAIIAGVAALALTACDGPGVLAPSESPSASATATTEPSTTPTPTETGTASPEPTTSESPLPTTPPVAGEIPCTDLLSAQQLYDFNPNFAPTAARGTLPGAIRTVADQGGTVCSYQHVTGSDRLIVAVLQDAAGFSAPAFEQAGGMGVATEVAGGTAIAVASEYFVEAGEASVVLDAVAANLG